MVQFCAQTRPQAERGPVMLNGMSVIIVITLLMMPQSWEQDGEQDPSQGKKKKKWLP